MIRRGDIYMVNLNPVQGREQTGTLGTKGANIARDYPTNVRVSPSDSGLPLETVFLCFHLRSLDPSRFPDTPAGTLSDTALERVENTIRYCLNL